jgi:putative oxidoreductase
MKVDPKGQVKGPAGFAAWLTQMGVPLPQFFAWVACLLETVGAVLLILGLGTRILAAAIVVDMMVAIALVKMKVMKAKFMDPKVQGWEFEFALLAQALTLMFCGAGGIALDAVVGL